MDSHQFYTYSLSTSLESAESIQKDKALYGSEDERVNLDELDNLNLDKSFIEIVKKQAQSIACLVEEKYLLKREAGGWQLTSAPTLAQKFEGEALKETHKEETFGEQEAFRSEYVAGFGTAFLVGKRLAFTAAHCICEKGSNIRNEKLIAAVRLVFGFQNAKQHLSDYIFTDRQVCKIEKVVSHQYTRIRNNKQEFTEWTDWALLELDRDVAYTPLEINMTEKVENKTGLYMLGHPSGLPLKFTYNGSVQINHKKDFFECNLDAFGGNSGSPIFNKITHKVVGILCSGGEDYEIIDNYRGKGTRRIQAHHITKQESGRNGFEICQRMNVLRFLLDNHLLGQEGINKQKNAPELIIYSLRENYKSRNTIPRLLHSALPIEEIYTELVLLHKNKKEDKKEEKKAFEEHRINSWEDIHAAKEPIQLNEFFEKKEEKIAKRLLILGRAGIGKSTLCQYIAHQWAKEKLWKGKFDTLFWVPLRKLQNAHSAETASSFLFRLCCQENSHELYPSDVADYIKQNQERILFVLDGLDEVPLTENSLQKRIVDELLQFPYWIITSRPHTAQSIQADATIENIGFASQTIDLYIRKFFPDRAQAIIKQIRQNPIIFGLCHIPINLELICSILKQSKGEISFIHSMTDLYEELTLILQRRFLEKIGKPNAWKWAKGNFEKDHQMQTIFKLIESIGWAGFQERELCFSFEKGQMKDIYCQYPPSDERDQLFIQICESGFIQSTGDHQEFLGNSYSFLHLTFQEFFSARYLVRLMQEDVNKAEKCIREIKFDPRYKVVMWFMAGLLKNDSKNLNIFFDILDTPKDIMGLYSALLKVRCLEECGWSDRIQISKLKGYEQEIQFWWRQVVDVEPRLYLMAKHFIEAFEISPQVAKRLFTSKLSLYLLNEGCIQEAVIYELYQNSSERQSPSLPLFPKVFKDENQTGEVNLQLMLPLFVKELNESGGQKFEAVVQALSQIGQTNPQLIFPLLVEALKNKNKDDWWVWDNSREIEGALDQIRQANPELTLPWFVEMLKGEDNNVKRLAIRVFGRIGHINPQLTLSLLGKALKDHNIYVREAAIIALNEIGKANLELTLPLLTKMVKDNDIHLREVVISVLGRIGKANPELTLPLLDEALNDKFGDVRITAIRAVGEIGKANSELAFPFLVKALKDNDIHLRKAAISALGEIGKANPKLTLPLLDEALNDKFEDITITAIRAIGEIGEINSELAFPFLVKALKDKVEDVRIFTIGVLGEIGKANPKLTLPLLDAAFKDENETASVRMRAIEVLGQMGQINAELMFPLLVKTLKDAYENESVRIAAIRPFYENESVKIKMAAIRALGQIGRANPQLTFSLLDEALKDEDKEVGHVIVQALYLIGQTDLQLTFPLLIKACKNKDSYVREAAAEILNDQIGKTNLQFALLLLVEAFEFERYRLFKRYRLFEDEHLIFWAIEALRKCDLSSYCKYDFVDLIHYCYKIKDKHALFISTPLSSLIKSCKEDPLNRLKYLSAIVIKCLEENQPIFQENDSLCCYDYEQNEVCRVAFPEAKQLFEQIEMCARAYPKCFEQSKIDKVKFQEAKQLLKQTSEPIETHARTYQKIGDSKKEIDHFKKETGHSKKESRNMNQDSRMCIVL